MEGGGEGLGGVENGQNAARVWALEVNKASPAKVGRRWAGATSPHPAGLRSLSLFTRALTFVVYTFYTIFIIIF